MTVTPTPADETPDIVAVMVVVPTSAPVSNPVALMEATVGSDELQMGAAPDTAEPSAFKPVAVNWSVAPEVT